MSEDPPALDRLKEIRNAARETGVAERAPEALAAYIDKVRRHAYKVTDEEVAALLAAGVTEKEIYEATMVTALTAAIDRFEIGLRALRGVK
jgi:alkylhydroperoxidase family enzyme